MKLKTKLRCRFVHKWEKGCGITWIEFYTSFASISFTFYNFTICIYKEIVIPPPPARYSPNHSPKKIREITTS